MGKTTITLEPATRDSLYHYCKKSKITYDKGIRRLLDMSNGKITQQESPKEPMYSACPFCQEQFGINQVPQNSKVFTCPKCGETMSIPEDWWK